MNEPNQPHTKDWRVIHSLAFFIVFLCTIAVTSLHRWPWPWLAPLLGYFALILCIPSLRRSFSWLSFGRIELKIAAFTFLIILVTAAVLLAISAPHFPNGTRHLLPFEALCGVFISCTFFAVLNATIEELVFRGILFDSLDSIGGKWCAILVSAFVFGFGHLHGIPSGASGACLAMIYGVSLGYLRFWSGGLALPILAHIGADATIVYRIVHAGTI